MNKLRELLGNLRSSFWFMPSLMVMGSIAFAVVLIEADSAGFNQWLSQWPRLFGVGAEGARQMLSTLAGSMITVMGITFSMTLLALVQASVSTPLAFCETSCVAASRKRRWECLPAFSLIA